MAERIAVAVSGGMDSLLALALLREQGQEVLAVHGRFLPEVNAPLEEGLAGLFQGMGVEFRVLDLRAQFEALVMAPFARDYARGLTPNPCAACNPLIKFGVLLDKAVELGADRLATGHYVRLEQGGAGPILYCGADPSRDQSYFLSLVPRAALARAVFPLGGLVKSQVPGLLAERGLVPPLPSESREICFVAGDDYGGFLQARGETLPGPGPMVLAESGEVIGRHAGLWRHTEGQRRGLGGGHAEPLYVLRKEAEANRLVVGPKRLLPVAGCLARGANLLVEPEDWPQGTDGPVLVQTRYRQRPVPAQVEVRPDTPGDPCGRSSGDSSGIYCGQTSGGNILDIRFLNPADRPAPGQVAALYDASGRVLAGGIISAYEEVS